MGKRGPKPKPTALKVLSGNPGKRPLPKIEPAPAGRLPPMPAGRLSRLGQLTWIRLRTVLEPIGLLTAADAEDFELLCFHYSQAMEAAQLVREQGFTLKDQYGRVYRNPVDKAMLEHSTKFQRLATLFGLTPSSRSGLHVELDDETDKSLADLLFEGTESGQRGKTRRNRLVKLVGAKPAQALAGSGFGSLDLAVMAAREGYELISIPGIGPATIRKLEDAE